MPIGLIHQSIDLSSSIEAFHRQLEINNVEKYILYIEDWLNKSVQDQIPTTITGTGSVIERGNSRKPLLVISHDGYHGTSLLAKWIHFHKNNNPQTKIVSHFSMPGQAENEFSYCIFKISSMLKEFIDDKKPIEFSEEKLRLYFSSWIDLAKERLKNRIVIIVDAIDKIVDSDGKTLNPQLWFPKETNSGIDVILSVSSSSQNLIGAYESNSSNLLQIDSPFFSYFPRLSTNNTSISSFPSISEQRNPCCIALWKIFVKYPALHEGLQVDSNADTQLQVKIMISRIISRVRTAFPQFQSGRIFSKILGVLTYTNKGLPISEIAMIVETSKENCSLALDILEPILLFNEGYFKVYFFEIHEYMRAIYEPKIPTNNNLNHNHQQHSQNTAAAATSTTSNEFEGEIEEELDSVEGSEQIGSNDQKKGNIDQNTKNSSSNNRNSGGESSNSSSSSNKYRQLIMKGLHSEHQCVRRMQELFFQARASELWLRLKDYLTALDTFIVFTSVNENSYFAFRYWKAIIQAGFDPVQEYAHAVEDYALSANLSDHDFFIIFFQISRFFKDFNEFETSDTPDFRHPKIKGNHILEEIGILGELKTLGMAGDERQTPGNNGGDTRMENREQKAQVTAAAGNTGSGNLVVGTNNRNGSSGAGSIGNSGSMCEEILRFDIPKNRDLARSKLFSHFAEVLSDQAQQHITQFFNGDSKQEKSVQQAIRIASSLSAVQSAQTQIQSLFRKQIARFVKRESSHNLFALSHALRPRNSKYYYYKRWLWINFTMTNMNSSLSYSEAIKGEDRLHQMQEISNQNNSFTGSRNTSSIQSSNNRTISTTNKQQQQQQNNQNGDKQPYLISGSSQDKTRNLQNQALQIILTSKHPNNKFKNLVTATTLIQQTVPFCPPTQPVIRSIGFPAITAAATLMHSGSSSNLRLTMTRAISQDSHNQNKEENKDSSFLLQSKRINPNQHSQSSKQEIIKSKNKNAGNTTNPAMLITSHFFNFKRASSADTLELEQDECIGGQSTCSRSSLLIPKRGSNVKLNAGSQDGSRGGSSQVSMMSSQFDNRNSRYKSPQQQVLGTQTHKYTVQVGGAQTNQQQMQTKNTMPSMIGGGTSKIQGSEQVSDLMLLPNLKQHLSQETNKELDYLVKQNFHMQKQFNALVYENTVLARELKRETKKLKNYTGVTTKDMSSTSKHRVILETNKQKAKIEKIQESIGNNSSLCSRISMIINICYRNQITNQENLNTFNAKLKSLGKMEQYEKEIAKDLKEKRSKQIRMTIEYMKILSERISNHQSILQQVKHSVVHKNKINALIDQSGSNKNQKNGSGSNNAGSANGNGGGAAPSLQNQLEMSAFKRVQLKLMAKRKIIKAEIGDLRNKIAVVDALFPAASLRSDTVYLHAKYTAYLENQAKKTQLQASISNLQQEYELVKAKLAATCNLKKTLEKALSDSNYICKRQSLLNEAQQYQQQTFIQQLGGNFFSNAKKIEDVPLFEVKNMQNNLNDKLNYSIKKHQSFQSTMLLCMLSLTSSYKKLGLKKEFGVGSIDLEPNFNFGELSEELAKKEKYIAAHLSPQQFSLYLQGKLLPEDL